MILRLRINWEKENEQQDNQTPVIQITSSDQTSANAADAISSVPTPAETQSPSNDVRFVHIDGMTCHSCEISIERRFKRISGISNVSVNATKGIARIECEPGRVPDLKQLQDAIKHHKYTVVGFGGPDRQPKMERPSLLRLSGLFVLVLLVASLFSRLGLFQQQGTVGALVSVPAALILGLVAGTSSCLAVSGGLLLSSAAKFNEKFGSRGAIGRMWPVFLFVSGRVISYGVLGGLIGAVGKTLTPSPLVTGALMVVAALYMLVMGLDMLKIAPAWLKALMPRMPKSLSHRVMDAEGKEHPIAPLLLGAGTFFLPCGFTQSLQLYALTTGSFLKSGLVLGAFALGTAPALMALGWASSSLKGKAGKFFFQFAGALVIILGLWNIQNGMTVAGYPIAWPKFDIEQSAVAAGSTDVAPIVNGEQVIKMTVDASSGGYNPDEFTVKAGIPVKWQINGANVAGCISYLQSRKLGIGLRLQPGPNEVSFTAPQAGTYSFSCSMGMYRGTINVIP